MYEYLKPKAQIEAENLVKKHGKEIALNLANSYMVDAMDDVKMNYYWHYTVKEINQININ
jgi:hypothetical protein